MPSDFNGVNDAPDTGGKNHRTFKPAFSTRDVAARYQHSSDGASQQGGSKAARNGEPSHARKSPEPQESLLEELEQAEQVREVLRWRDRWKHHEEAPEPDGAVPDGVVEDITNELVDPTTIGQNLVESALDGRGDDVVVLGSTEDLVPGDSNAPTEDLFGWYESPTWREDREQTISPTSPIGDFDEPSDEEDAEFIEAGEQSNGEATAAIADDGADDDGADDDGADDDGADDESNTRHRVVVRPVNPLAVTVEAATEQVSEPDPDLSASDDAVISVLNTEMDELGRDTDEDERPKSEFEAAYLHLDEDIEAETPPPPPPDDEETTSESTQSNAGAREVLAPPLLRAPLEVTADSDPTFNDSLETSKEPVPPVRPKPKRAQPGLVRARRVKRIVRRIDPWSVLKVAIILGVCLYVVCLLSGIILWNVLDQFDLIDRAEETMVVLGFSDFQFHPKVILAASALGGAVMVVFLAGLCGLGAVLYNLICDLVGGVRLTVIEEPGTELVKRQRLAPKPTGGVGDSSDTVQRPDHP